LREAGLMEDLEYAGFHTVGYGCTSCIAEGTPVLLADGTACPIEDLPENGGVRLLAPTPDGELVVAELVERLNQGARECVTLVLEDGRELVCTPDHEILCEGGRWVRADRLELRRDQVVVAVGASAAMSGHRGGRVMAHGSGAAGPRHGLTAIAEYDESLDVSSVTMLVIDRQPAGLHRVFDLSVSGPHAFIAGTVAVHNCIGNSGPLPEPIAEGITSADLVAAAVLSGNRNFEGRVNPHTRANYLASPPLVVAYALAGTVDIDLDQEPLGTGQDGKPVYLRDLWPTQQEIAATIAKALKPEQFGEEYANVFDGNPKWNAIPVAGGELYEWSDASTYIHEPPFFQGLAPEPAPVKDIRGASVLVMVADSVTTDHISPAGDIADASPAGQWLKARGLQKRDFNSYGSRRGNDLVMVRGTFANIRLKNLLVPGSEGNVTVHFGSGETTSIFEASERYRGTGTPLLVLAGKEYGAGSSRDWAAKGTLLLGVKAVLAESYERIHRSNLVGMGVLPLQYETGQSAERLGLTGRETFTISGLEKGLAPRMKLQVEAARADGSKLSFTAIARIDTPVEVDYYRNGGILQTVLRSLARR
ncbi:MAG TPA: aconitase family protein, partial [Candidatus Eisenbacteria bacterium]|nr:aconitase family protein [Candidatus Eisenbacteria bacterium]